MKNLREILVTNLRKGCPSPEEAIERPHFFQPALER